MMQDIAGLIREINGDGTIDGIIANAVLAQFGTPNRRLIGAELMPLRPNTNNQNAFRERAITFRTVMANDGTRYSPVQLKKGARTASMMIELAEIDTGGELDAQMYDELIALLDQDLTMDATFQITNYLDTTVIQGLVQKMEKMRWDALITGNLRRATDFGILDPVVYPNPVGHRVTVASGTVGAPTGWYDPTRDPMQDIYARVQFLKDKGWIVNRITMSSKKRTQLLTHPKVTARANRITIVNGGSGPALNLTQGRITVEDLDALVRAEGLPPFTVYDEIYNTDTSTGRYLPDTAILFTSNTNREQVIPLGDDEPLIILNTIGYQALGRATGQPRPGIQLRVRSFDDDKDVRIEAKGWATTLPVILMPESMSVLSIPNPS